MRGSSRRRGPRRLLTYRGPAHGQRLSVLKTPVNIITTAATPTFRVLISRTSEGWDRDDWRRLRVLVVRKCLFHTARIIKSRANVSAEDGSFPRKRPSRQADRHLPNHTLELCNGGGCDVQ